ncbi:hypothetical protein QZN11_23600 [Streptomyces gramineus]|uniref:hypothetical protein n=1 Tax=Streptomyces gramineus TaxID=910542 RepID=UPI00398AD062
MPVLIAVPAAVSVLAAGSAVVKARRGRWWDAASVLLPVLGVDPALLSEGGWAGPPLFWAGAVLVLAGFGAEGWSYLRTRDAGRVRQPGR